MIFLRINNERNFQMTKLSIIVPVFNVGKLVKKCLDTLINQSYSDIEIIIINDGSTDNSKEYIELFRNIEYIKIIDLLKNSGLGNARNIGISNATGEYITFVDSDDWIDLDLYMEMINSLKVYNSDIVICGIKNEFNNALSSENRYLYHYFNHIDSEMALKLLVNYVDNNYRISPVVWNKIYRKQLIDKEKISFLNNSFWEDDIFTFQVLMNAKAINIIPNVNYHYYQREKSITNDFSKKHIEDLVLSFKYLKNYLKEKNKWEQNREYYNAYLDRAICSMFKMLFKNEPSITKQKAYIMEFYNRFSEEFSISEAISYLDVNRIKRLFI